MSYLADSPVLYAILHSTGTIAGDQQGWGGTLAFHLGEGVGGAATDVIAFCEFVGGVSETVVIGGVAVERIVPLRHPYLTGLVARSVRAEKTGRPIDAIPGWTDWKVTVEFGQVLYDFGGDTPYLTLRRRYGASAITLPGRAFAVSSVPLNHDVARVIPEIVYSATQYNVPSRDDSVFVTLAGKLNNATFLGFAAETVRFDGVEDEITMLIGGVTNRTVSLNLTWRPVSWNKILLPSGIWASPLNINDGLGIYETGNFALLLG